MLNYQRLPPILGTPQNRLFIHFIMPPANIAVVLATHSCGMTMQKFQVSVEQWPHLGRITSCCFFDLLGSPPRKGCWDAA